MQYDHSHLDRFEENRLFFSLSGSISQRTPLTTVLLKPGVMPTGLRLPQWT